MRLASLLLLSLTLWACGGEDVPGSNVDAMPQPDSMTCNLAPREDCCFDDGDCPATDRCYTQTCAADGEGRCEPPAPAGMCWADDECPAGQTCQGEQICPCGVRCLVPDSPGTCHS
jgi:hypothetical protein